MAIERTDLQNLAFTLLAKWYSVLSDKEEQREYFSFSDGVNIGYVQHGRYEIGFSFSKTNQPSKENWTWFIVLQQVEATTANARMTLNAYPYLQDARRPIVRYETVQQFINYQQKFWKDYGAINQNEVEQRIK